MAAQCHVSAKDYRQYWQGTPAPSAKPEPSYRGPERRENKHDRRFYAGIGGRRTLDRKS